MIENFIFVDLRETVVQMEPTLELSHSKAYVNVKWENNAAAGNS